MELWTQKRAQRLHASADRMRGTQACWLQIHEEAAAVRHARIPYFGARQEREAEGEERDMCTPSAERETAMRSSRCERSSFSSGLKVATRSGRQGYLRSKSGRQGSMDSCTVRGSERECDVSGCT